MEKPNPIKPFCVIRPEDFLVIAFEFINVGLVAGEKGKPKILVPFNFLTGLRPAIVMQFQPQSIGEETFFEQAEGMPVTEDPRAEPRVPVRGEFARPSRVGFELPASFTSAPFTLESLLEICYKNTNFPFVRAFIEAPFLLNLRPGTSQAGWKHPLRPITHNGRTELWRTQLAVVKPGPDGDQVDEFDSGKRFLRAIDSRAWPPGVTPFSLPLEKEQGQKIVKASPFRLIPVNRLMLSSLGAWLDVHADWSGTAGAAHIQEWQHRMTLGRDHYVRTVEPGFLYPFGHRASLVTISERKFQTDPQDQRAAFLRRRMHIIVREPERAYNHHDFPFNSLTILNLSTPDLAPPDESAVVDQRLGGEFSFGVNAFYPRILQPNQGIITDFLFHLRGRDWDSHTVEFHLPLLFVQEQVARLNPFTMIAHYNQDPIEMNAAPNAEDVERNKKRRHIFLGGQSVAYAKTPSRNAALESDGMLVQARFIAGSPPVRPQMEAAIVRVPAVNQLTGRNDPVEISTCRTPFHCLNPDDPGGVFARVWNPGALVELPLERAGGLTAPNFSISGLSTHLGPVGGKVESIVQGDFDPADFFGGFAPKIFGGLSLLDILPRLNSLLPDSFGDGSAVPRLTREVSTSQIKAILDWKPQVKSSHSPPEKSLFHARLNGASATLTLKSVLTTPLGGGSPTYFIDGTLENFTIQLLAPEKDLIHLPFHKLNFHSESGKKTDVSASLGPVEFVGPLTFVNRLAELIPAEGFSDPPSVDVTPGGVDVNYSIGLPQIAMGYFSLQNLSFSAGLRLPFIGDPATLRFAFSERHSPFLLTVSAVGGGGFFGLELSLKGIQRIEFALEFGGNIAFDIGIASGGVLIMGGIYYENNAGAVRLTGFVRIAGAVEVLGLICISVQFFLGLEYDIAGRKAWGVATLKVEIEVLFFSKDVSLTVRREFPKGADPTFAQMIPDLRTWQEYCDAFAVYGSPA